MAGRERSPYLYDLMSKGKKLEYAKGDIVYSTFGNNSLMMVEKGFVKRYMIASDGSINTQIIYGAHDIFSFTKLYQNLLGQSIYDGPETYHYEAMSPARLFSVDTKTLKAALEQNPLIYKELFSEAGRHLKVCVNSIESMARSTTYERVAHQLLFFARQFGEDSPEGIFINMPLTHQDIASIVGTTRETVTLALVKLREKGIINGQRGIVVKDMAGLATEAYR